MPAKKNVRCERCGKRLKKGGDNYRLECSVTADFDGCLDASIANTSPEEILDEIEKSEVTEAELEEQVYFNTRQKLCHDCRNIIVSFLKGYEPDAR